MPLTEYKTWLTRECNGIEVSVAVVAVVETSAACAGSSSAPPEPACAEVTAVEIATTRDERMVILEAWEEAQKEDKNDG